MRAACDSPAAFFAPQAADADHDTGGDDGRDAEATDAASEFAATLGLLAIPPPPPAVEPALGVETAVVTGAIAAAAPRPAPTGIDISSFELMPPDQQTALPLEAALQQLTATTDMVAPESEPVRVITAAHEVIEVVARHVARGEQQITMVLRPAELGEVKVRVEHVRHDQVKITLEAEKPDATRLLRERVPELQAALQQQGVTVRSIDVSLQASDGMSQRGGAGGDAPRREHAEPGEPAANEEARPPKRTRRNKKDLDVLV